MQNSSTTIPRVDTVVVMWRKKVSDSSNAARNREEDHHRQRNIVDRHACLKSCQLPLGSLPVIMKCWTALEYRK